ncbi:MAG: protein kinase, partial [Myxococcota bacterium]
MVRKGGLSVLVCAQDLRSAGPVALKIVTLDPFDEGIRQRLQREVAILRRLDHPRIVRCLDAGSLSEMQVYLALEWLDGQDLAQLLSRGPVTLRTALEVIAQVADALHAAHREGVIHRDIKPANIFVMAQA